MKRTNTDAEQIMTNLRALMREAEEVLGRGYDRMNEEQLEALKSRLKIGASRLRDAYEDAEDRVKEIYADVEDKISDYSSAIEDKIRGGLHTTDQSLRKYPYRTAAMAFAAGIVAGAFFASKK